MGAITPAEASRLIKPFTVTDGRTFRLGRFDPGDTGGIGSKTRSRQTEGARRRPRDPRRRPELDAVS